MYFTTLCTMSALLAIGVHAHGDHGKSIADDGDWASFHMAEEHHIQNYDPTTFFTLHDFNSDGVWTPDEVRRFYGFDDESNKDTDEEHKKHAVHDVFALFDENHTGQITKGNWLRWIKLGRVLPDFGLGPGHHGDDEYEYEIHHFEKYHDENTKEEDLIHPEDIAHFAKHDREEDEAERIEKMQKQTIVAENIPMKFRKQQ